jgi:hypothetical protein
MDSRHVGKPEERAKDIKPVNPRCNRIIEQGIHTAQDFAGAMSAMMSDIVAGRIDPMVANAVCNAGGKLLKAVEMQYKYGVKGSGENKKVLRLVENQ